MLKIYTGYFGGIKKYNYINPVSISMKQPYSCHLLEEKTLAPTWEILSDYKIDPTDDLRKDAYVSRYINEILKVNYPDPIKLGEHLENKVMGFKDDQVITLLCFEKPNDFCHRHLVASYLGSVTTDKYIVLGEWLEVT